MDWIDPRYNISVEEPLSSSRRGKGKRTKSNRSGRGAKNRKALASQVGAAVAQPPAVWAAAFDHGLSRLKWPAGCTIESTFLFSAVMQEQAEVLVRAGMSAKKLAAILHEASPASVAQELNGADALAEVVGLMDQPLESLAFQWLDTADAYAHAALGVAAVAWHLPEHARRPGNEWLSSWLQAASDRMHNYAPDLEEPVLCHLIFQCELPLLMGVATAASKRTILAEASRAMDNLAEYLERSLENPAAWLVHGATYLRAELASVLRCRVLANHMGLRKWFPPQQKSLRGLLKHAARWCRYDGTQLLAAGNTSPRAKSIWEALAKQSRSSKSLRSTMDLAGIGQGKRREALKVKTSKLPGATYYNEDASCGSLRSSWKQKSGQVAVDFSDTDICLEAIGPKGQLILVGDWLADIELDGQRQLQVDEWGELCWFSDNDVDYLELETRFGEHARLQRQVALFRRERLLMLADTLLCGTPGAWSIRSQLPLAAGAVFEPEKKSNEGRIVLPRQDQCLVLPLYLPEWRREKCRGSLSVDGEHLILHQECRDLTSCYQPLLISLQGSHAQQPFTWRRLTVGEDLRIVRDDEAVAYRTQIGQQQWLLYRTLAAAKRRTALGMHTLADFYAGRFSASEGDVETIVEVETSETAAAE